MKSGQIEIKLVDPRLKKLWRKLRKSKGGVKLKGRSSGHGTVDLNAGFIGRSHDPAHIAADGMSEGCRERGEWSSGGNCQRGGQIARSADVDRDVGGLPAHLAHSNHRKEK
jgi:hypothetical protein